MKGLDLMGVKQRAPYVGAALGVVVGALVLAFTGKHTRGLLGRSHLFGRSVPRLARIGAGAAVGAALGVGAGAVVKKVA